jgi:D-serine dehydratase
VGSATARPPFDRRAVEALSAVPIPRSAKGFGGLPADRVTTAHDLIMRKARIFDGTFTFPLLTLRESAVAHNVAQLARFCDDSGVALAPHAKTTMAPQLFAGQLTAGAWGLTVATVGQAQRCREFGVRRLMMANELVDPAGISWLAGELVRDHEFDFCCYVDSLEGVRLLDSALRRTQLHDAKQPSPRLGVLVELGYPGGRTGCRRLADAIEVARAANSTQTLSVVGVAGYEGGIAHGRGALELEAVEGFCRRLVDLADQLVASGIMETEPVISAGGSAYPDVVARILGAAADRATVVLRSGCYVTHDDGEYARVSPFTQASGSPYALTAALELWTQVLSLPEPRLALLGAGRRDVGFDQGFPVPRAHRDAAGTVRQLTGSARDAMRVTQLNDQHAYLELPNESGLAVGDLLSLGVSHPCTTLDRWRHVVQVDDDDLVTDVVFTHF